MPPVRLEVFVESVIFCLASLGEPQHVQTSSPQLFFSVQNVINFKVNRKSVVTPENTINNTQNSLNPYVMYYQFLFSVGRT